MLGKGPSLSHSEGDALTLPPFPSGDSEGFRRGCPRRSGRVAPAQLRTNQGGNVRRSTGAPPFAKPKNSTTGARASDASGGCTWDGREASPATDSSPLCKATETWTSAAVPQEMPAGTQVMMSTPNSCQLEIAHSELPNYIAAPTPALDVRNGFYHVSDRPGHGHELNPDNITAGPDKSLVN